MAIATMLLFCILFWQHLPYQNLAGQQIINILAAKNIKVSSLKVESANNAETIISNIKLNGNPGLNLEHLKLKYDWSIFAAGKLNSLEAENIAVNLYKKNRIFIISGLEDAFSNTTNNKTSINQSNLLNIIPAKISLKNCNILAKIDDLEFSLPLNLNFRQNPTTILDIDSPGINVILKPYQLVTQNIHFNAILDDSGTWQGEINIPVVKITGLASELPPFLIKINFSLDTTNLLAKIILHNDDNIIKTDIELSMPVAHPNAANLNIKEIQLPWGGGSVSTKSVNIQLDMKSPILFNINLKQVDLAETLGKISNGKIKGTGKIEGIFPVIYNQDGSIILKEGIANEMSEGVISVSPELMPGNNAQLELARNLLQNFHYTHLKIMVSSKEEKSAINLMLVGGNPNSPDKQPIKFNINLTGDIMPLIQQSITPFNDIKELLKQEK